MTFDFIRQVVENPELAKSIGDGAEIDFIDKDMPVRGKEAKKGRRVTRYKVEHVFEPVEG